MIRSILAAVAFLFTLPATAQDASINAAALKSHVQFLASDALRGREASSRDYDVASEYMAAQMEAAGLKPGINGSWFQPIKLTKYKPAEKGTWTLTRGDHQIPLQFGMDFFNTTANAQPEFNATGGVVFVGHGVVYPEAKIDEYRGLDVRGKIVAMLPGAPKGLPDDADTFFSDDEQKAILAGARGAKAVILLESAAQQANYPFDAITRFWDYMRSGWAHPDGKSHLHDMRAPILGYVSQIGAEKLFQGSKMRWIDVLVAERKGAKIPTGNLLGTLRIGTKLAIMESHSRNIIGLLEGSDPALKNEYIVVSAHLDHMGISDPLNGDRIYNGAMDNAIGNAMLIEVARAFTKSGKPPRRSILFVALTAEETGLHGSQYFLKYPPVPQGSIVANINTDMPILSYKLEDIVVLGAERSTLGPMVEAAAASEGLVVVPDPMPEEVFFTRSDHYSFVQAGIPAISIDSGPGGQGAAAQKEFLEKHYHKPSDEIGLIHWESATRFARVNYAIARAITDADRRPVWNKGDFFGLQFNGPGAK